MKKAIGILVLGLLWCNVGFAMSQQEAIDNYLKDRKLEKIQQQIELTQTFKKGLLQQMFV